MRKLLITANVILAVFYFSACKQKLDLKPGSTNKCGLVVCKDYSGIPLDGVVDGNTLRSMSQAYADDRGKGFVSLAPDISGPPERDALSVVFRLEQLKNLISQIEQAACNAGCDSTTELAIRFYMIKYPANMGSTDVASCLKSLPAFCSNKHSLAMVPAFKKDKEYYDFSLNNLVKDCFQHPLSITDSGSKRRAAIIAIPMPGSGDNHGDLGPPPGLGVYPTNE